MNVEKQVFDGDRLRLALLVGGNVTSDDLDQVIEQQTEGELEDGRFRSAPDQALQMKDFRDFLEDLLNAVKQSETLCSIAVKTIRSLRDSYNILFTNNLHKTIKLLTSLTIIFNIPTMIASIYGMNIDLPLARHTYSFMLILSMITTLTVVAFIIFRRKRFYSLR